MPTGDCNSSLPTWNATSQLCTLKEDAVCALIEGTMEWGGTWGCVLPSLGCHSAIPVEAAQTPGEWIVQVDGDTKFPVRASNPNEICSGQGHCRPRGTLCPTKGSKADPSSPCNSSMHSWNSTQLTCILPVDTECNFRTTQTSSSQQVNNWQCEYPINYHHQSEATNPQYTEDANTTKISTAPTTSVPSNTTTIPTINTPAPTTTPTPQTSVASNTNGTNATNTTVAPTTSVPSNTTTIPTINTPAPTTTPTPQTSVASNTNGTNATNTTVAPTTSVPSNTTTIPTINTPAPTTTPTP
ncbi:hypothetical protein AeMF1_018276, partial [Aphanomyces euteiches]